MIETLLTIIGLSSLTVLFVKAEPLIILKRLLGFKEENYFEYNRYKQFTMKLITCCLCSGWWLSLITLLCLGNDILYTIYLSAIISVLSEFIGKKIDY